MWNEINNEKDLADFMYTVCDFHDGCIKELKYISGAFVGKQLGMHPINDERILNLIIQRQFENPSVVEMEFIGLRWLKMYPLDDKYTCEILDSTMIIKDDCIYWCDEGNLTEEDLLSYEGTVICASKVRWRACDEYLGEDDVYVLSKQQGS